MAAYVAWMHLCCVNDVFLLDTENQPRQIWSILLHSSHLKLIALKKQSHKSRTAHRSSGESIFSANATILNAISRSTNLLYFSCASIATLKNEHSWISRSLWVQESWPSYIFMQFGAWFFPTAVAIFISFGGILSSRFAHVPCEESEWDNKHVFVKVTH